MFLKNKGKRDHVAMQGIPDFMGPDKAAAASSSANIWVKIID